MQDIRHEELGFTLKKQEPWDTAEGRMGSLQVCRGNSFMQLLVSLAQGLHIHVGTPVRTEFGGGWGRMPQSCSPGAVTWLAGQGQRDVLESLV